KCSVKNRKYSCVVISISPLFLFYSYYVNISSFHTKHLLFLFFFCRMWTIPKLMCAFRPGYTLSKTTATSANMLLEDGCKQQSSDIHSYPRPIRVRTKV